MKTAFVDKWTLFDCVDLDHSRALSTQVSTYGHLGVDGANDRVQCHICGAWLGRLDPHLRSRHGWTAAWYRIVFGLNWLTPLVAPSARAKISEAAIRNLSDRLSRGFRPFDVCDADDLASIRAKRRAAVMARPSSFEGKIRRRQSWTPERRAQRSELTRVQNATRSRNQDGRFLPTNTAEEDEA